MRSNAGNRDRSELGATALNRLACAALALSLTPATPVCAQNQAINDLKGKIFDARMAKETFVNGLRHCAELDGHHFYFQPRDRVLDLDEYHRSLESLAHQGVFNPEKKRPWTEEDAAERWAQVKEQALKDQATCALVASLPDMEKQLAELEQKAQTSDKK
jgi:hypothetical protein